MIRRALLLMIWLLTQPLLAQEALVLPLRERASCRGHTVQVGDLTTVPPDRADLATLPVAPAPAPGETCTLSRAALESRLRAAGCAGVILCGPELVTVEPELAVLAGQSLSELAVAWAREQLAAPGVSVEVAPCDPLPPTTVQVPVGRERSALRPRWREGLPANGALQVEVAIELDGVIAARVPVGLRARRTASGVVTRRPLTGGQPLAASDLQEVTVELPPGAAAPPAPGALIGLVTRRPLRKGELVLLDACAPPPVVRKGERVVVEVQVGALTVTSEGRARGDAAQGEPLEVQLAGRTQPAQAVALAPGRVLVRLEVER